MTPDVFDSNPMTFAQRLAATVQELRTDPQHTEAVLRLIDGSRLCFRHRVGERWAKAVGSEREETAGGEAAALVNGIRFFRLNARHLDVEFTDGSCWEKRFQGLGQ